MSILVLGAQGQVGYECLRHAADAVGLDRAQLNFHDARQIEAVVARHRPRVVINAIAYTAVDQAEQDVAVAEAVNRDGPSTLAAACAQHGAALIHFSTDYVFDGQAQRPYIENDPVHPLSVYGRTKLEGEMAVQAQLERHLILRTSWVFGARRRNFLLSILNKARQDGALSVVADQYGGPTPAASLAVAAVGLAQRIVRGESLDWGLYHFAGAPATTWHGFAEAIVAGAVERGLLPHPVEVRPMGMDQLSLPAARPRYSVLDSGKARAHLGLAPPDWRRALLDTLSELPRSAA